MWVKICGIRDVETATWVCIAGADAVGLNFFTPSPRSVSVPMATDIVKSLPESVIPVGLFVNHAVAEVTEIARSCGLRTLQLHGDESPEYLAELQGFDLIKAFRVSDGAFGAIDDYLGECRRLGVTLWGCLIDAHVKGSFGGTGQRADWEGLQRACKTDWPRLILAGGLTPENVQKGICEVHPWGVDTASGVESSPGVKEASLIEAFVLNAKRANA